VLSITNIRSNVLDFALLISFRQCEFSHNPNPSTASYETVGENIFRTGLTPSQIPNSATQAWFDEVEVWPIVLAVLFCLVTHFVR